MSVDTTSTDQHTGLEAGQQPKRNPITNKGHVDPALILNAMTTRADLLTQLFDPRRDINDECGYSATISIAEYSVMYNREIGRRVVNVYPEESWKRLPDIYEDADAENETPFEASFSAIDKKHHILHYLQRADELSGIGEFGVILWGVNDGLALNEPIEGYESWEECTGKPQATQKSTKRDVIYVRVLDQSQVVVSDTEKDVTNPRYGKPTLYSISLAAPGGSSAVSSTDQKVHWSRITHVTDNRGTSEVLGTPRQKPVWNRLYDLRKVLGGSGEMFWRGGFPGISLETQPGLENAELNEESTREMMFNYMNSLQRYIATTGMTAKSLAPQIADPSKSFEVQIKAICITLGVPYRVFMGVEEGVVAGNAATNAWISRLVNRQERYITPCIIDVALQRLIDIGVLEATVVPQGWIVEWPDLTAPSETERAEISVRKTEAMAKFVTGGVDTLMPPYEFLTLVLGMPEDVAEAVMAAALTHIEGIQDDEVEEVEVEVDEDIQDEEDEGQDQ